MSELLHTEYYNIRILINTAEPLYNNYNYYTIGMDMHCHPSVM